MHIIILIYVYYIYICEGPAAAEDLLAECHGDVLIEKSARTNNIRSTVFNRFFTLLHTG